MESINNSDCLGYRNFSTKILRSNNKNDCSVINIDQIDTDLKLPPQDEKSGTLSNRAQSIYKDLSVVLHKNKNRLRNVSYIIAHLLLIGYFSWATYYFLKYSEATLSSTMCTNYGLLMILFIFVNFGVVYSWLIRPFLVPIIIRFIWTPLNSMLINILSKRFMKPILYVILMVVVLVFLVYDSAQDYRKLIPICGILIFLAVGFVFSKHPKQINWCPVIWGLILQFLCGLLTIRWKVGRNVFECVGNRTETFLGYATEGAVMVYGDFLIHKVAVFAFQALASVYFLGFVINILYYYGIMQKLIVSIGSALQAIMGTSICESVNCAANIFLGMCESPILLKPYLPDLTVSEINSIMTSGFASVSGTVLAAYISFGANAAHLLTSSVMSAPAALCYSKLLYPETEKVKATKKSISLTKLEYSSVMDAASKGALMGTQVVLGIIANLISFIGFMYFLNGVFSWTGELVGYYEENAWTIEGVAGYAFMPISYIMGVPWEECQHVGRLIGIKTFINEFAAFKAMSTLTLSKRSKIIATYAICGFSNPGSIGIMISALSVLVPSKAEIVTKVIFRALIGGEIVCFMTACFAALLMPDTFLD